MGYSPLGYKESYRTERRLFFSGGSVGKASAYNAGVK